MKKLLLFSILLLSSFGVYAQQLDWVKTLHQPFSRDLEYIGTSDSMFISTGEVSHDSLGNVFWAGQFSDSITLGNQTFRNSVGMYLCKYNTAGNLQWSIVPDTRVHFNKITTDRSGNVFVTGIYVDSLRLGNQKVISSGQVPQQNKQSVFLAKIAPQGQCIWLKSYPLTITGSNWSNPSPLHSIYNYINTDPQGNIIITSITRNFQIHYDQFKTNPLPVLGVGFNFIKISPAGNVAWIKSFESYDHAWIKSVTVDATGNIVAAVWPQDYFKDDAGNQVLNSVYTCLLKISTSGSTEWVKPTQLPWEAKLATDPNSNIYLAGSFSKLTIDTLQLISKEHYVINLKGDTINKYDGTDILLAKLNSSGNLQWIKQFGSHPGDYMGNICVDDQSNIYLTGYFNDSTQFDNFKNKVSSRKSGQFFTKINSSGVVIWADHFEEIMFTFRVYSSFAHTGHLYITGATGKNVKWNNQPIPSANYDQQLFLAKIYAPNPVTPPTSQGQVSVLAFPNPARQNLQYTVTLPAADPISVFLINSMGQVVYQTSYPSGNLQQTYSIPLSGIPAGRYQLQVQSASGVASTAVVIFP